MNLNINPLNEDSDLQAFLHKLQIEICGSAEETKNKILVQSQNANYMLEEKLTKNKASMVKI